MNSKVRLKYIFLDCTSDMQVTSLPYMRGFNCQQMIWKIDAKWLSTAEN